MEINEAIRFLRMEAGLTQAELAQKLNVGQSTVCQWESGKCSPNAEALIMLSSFYNISADFLLGISDNKDGDAKLDDEVEECIALFDNLTSYQRALIKDLMKQMKPF